MSRAGNKVCRACLLALVVCVAFAGAAVAQRRVAPESEAEFGPVVRAYLGYLRAQQEVVDDRVSRREVNQSYYRRNSNRIRALRQMAVRIARETQNDYLPELEAVTPDEFNIIFDEPPSAQSLSVGATLNHTFRYLGALRSGTDRFHLFARLDPYEQAELRKKAESQQPQATAPQANAESPKPPVVKSSSDLSVRPRRVSGP